MALGTHVLMHKREWCSCNGVGLVYMGNMSQPNYANRVVDGRQMHVTEWISRKSGLSTEGRFRLTNRLHLSKICVMKTI